MKTMYIIKIDDDLYLSSYFAIDHVVSSKFMGMSGEPNRSLFISSKKIAETYTIQIVKMNPEFKDRVTVHEVIFP